ncbi:hypothetical protein DXG01_005098 [Tephrocybe rancida]|nr:hypothetical protein DXG01_005098 [Tephrocybe rancida]
MGETIRTMQGSRHPADEGEVRSQTRARVLRGDEGGDEETSMTSRLLEDVSPRGRGRFSDYRPPRGHGGIGDSPRGRGRGRGGSKLSKDASLSDLLFQERPLLRPIVFVPSVHTKTLFQEEEEILQAIVEEVGEYFGVIILQNMLMNERMTGEEEQSHVPTADRVFRVFSGGNIPRMPSISDDEGDEDALEEIDFNDMAKLMETPTRSFKNEVDVVEERFLGIRLGTNPAHEIPQPTEATNVDALSVDSQTTISDHPSAEVAEPASIVIDDNDISTSRGPESSLIAFNHGTTPSSQEPVPETQQETISQEQPIAPVTVDSNVTAPSRVLLTKVQEEATPSQETTGFYIDTSPSHVHPSPTPDLGVRDKSSKIVVDIQDSDVPSIESTSSFIVEETTVTIDSTPIEVPAPATSPVAPKEFDGFYIDTQPSHVDAPHRGRPEILEDDEEEIIVYVAPHPGRASPTPATSYSAPFLPSTSILTGTTSLASTSQWADPPSTNTVSGSIPTSTPPIHPRAQAQAPSFESVSFSFTPTPKKGRDYRKRSKAKTLIKQRRQEAHATRRRMEQHMLFGSFGAMMEEANLRGMSSRELDSQWDERRRGDSDVDWGDEEGEDGNGALGVAEGMDLDPDLEVDIDTMKRFAKSMSAEGTRFVTMDDIADGEMMRMEDDGNDRQDVGSSGEDEEDETTDDAKEVDDIVNAEEKLLIAEPGDVEMEVESDEDDSDESETSPRTSFQAKLERLRNHTNAKGKKRAAVQEDFDEESDGDDEADYFNRADEDEDFIEQIQMYLEENQDTILGRDRKARNQLFRAVRNGAFEDLDDFKPARKSKDKYKDLPPELQEQWQMDRDKKADHKRLRALKRLELAADPLAPKKGGSKGRKAMLAAAKLDPTITVLPNRVIDMTTLVQQIRRFVGDVGGPVSMSLPPTTKETRAKIHEMARAFNLKSGSKGKGDARYTTLMKTSKSGIFVDEQKVAKIVRRSGGGGGGRGEFMGSNSRGGRGGAQIAPRHKEGEEVGKAAPKIGQSNIGFQMLALMGWTEGQSIGMAGGLDAPLTAVIKTTKLGLGATR